MKTMLKYSLLVALLVAFTSTVHAKSSKICIEQNGKTISVSVNAVPAFVKKGAMVGCSLEEKTAFAWFLQTSPSDAAIVDAAANVQSVVASYNAYLASFENDYEEVGAESADVEGEEDVEE